MNVSINLDILIPRYYSSLAKLEESLQPAFAFTAMLEDGEGFDSIFGEQPDLAYSQLQVTDIQRHRRKLENELFFDKLLKALSVEDPSVVYPCPSNASLRALHHTIVTSPAPGHIRSSLIYYLLKDLSKSAISATDYAETRSGIIPPMYRIYIDGVWALDNLDLQTAVGHLASPQINNPGFPGEIMYHICNLSKASDPGLALAYFDSTSPPLENKEHVTALFSCYLRANITEAFFWAGTHTDEIHKMLLEQLIIFVHADAGGELRSNRAMELLALPMSTQERNWSMNFLRDGRGRSLYGARDTLIMLDVEQGVTGGMHGGRMVDGVNWSVLGGNRA